MSVASLQLVQEFEIVPGDEADPRVSLALSGKIECYVRSETRGMALLRQADAAVYSQGGGPAVWLNFPGCQASGTDVRRCSGEFEVPPLTLPSGRYALVVTLVLETATDGPLRGHSVAVFATGFNAGRWTSPDAVLDDLDEEALGLAVTVKTTPPPSK
jgi:hypothetical protein